MFPQSMLRADFSTEGSNTDLTHVLEQHIRAGFQPDLALDLVLNELVIRAAEATRASSAALALARGEELVCRAATGNFAPDLGVPLNPREGLSGVCLRTREPQLSVDTELDPRVAVAFARRFGIRSVLAVPVFDADSRAEFTGVLEVFSASPAAFSRADQRVLEAFASECARVRLAAFKLAQRGPALDLSAFDSPRPVTPGPVPVPSPIPPSNGAQSLPPQSSPAQSLPVQSWPAQSLPVEPLPNGVQPFVAVQPPLPEPLAAPRILFAPEHANPEVTPGEFAEFATDEANTFQDEEAEGGEFAGNEAESVEDEPVQYEPSAYEHRVEHAALRPAQETIKQAEVLPSFAALAPPPPARSFGYEAWSLILGVLSVVAIIGVSFLIGTRIGWLRASESPARALRTGSENAAVAAPERPAEENKPIEMEIALPKTKTVRKEPKPAPAAKSPETTEGSGDLVVYEKGKVIFRMKNPPEAAKPQAPDSASAVDSNRAAAGSPVAAADSSNAAQTRGVWLNPAEAENRLVSRIEPEYPLAARASRRAGDVVLEVNVAEDGSVSSVRTIKGDPVLAAAATQAVRNWRYQPYRFHDRPSQFRTDVTLNFAVSN